MPNRKNIAILCAGGDVSGIISRGGTKVHTARSKRFMGHSDLLKLGMEYGNNK